MRLEKVNEILEEKATVNERYKVRKGVPDARYNDKYTLYCVVDSGFACPGTYGKRVAGFKTLNEVLNWIENI